MPEAKTSARKKTATTKQPKKTSARTTTTRPRTATAKKTKKRKKIKIPAYLWYEIGGVFAVLFAIITSFQLGVIGQTSFHLFLSLFGVATPVVLLALAGIGGAFIWQQTNFRWSWKKLIAVILLLTSLVTISAIITPQQTQAEFWQAIEQVHQGSWQSFWQTRGGVIGTQIFSVSQQLIGTFGTLLGTIVIIVFASLLLSQRSLAQSLAFFGQQITRASRRIQQQLQRRQQKQSKQQQAQATSLEITGLFADEAVASQGENYPREQVIEQPTIHLPKVEPLNQVVAQRSEVKIIDQEQRWQQPESEPATKPYIYPSLHLLQDVKATDLTQMKSTIDGNIERLQQIFASFKIGVTISAVNVGPAITQYEIQPEPGVKVSRIVNLADDIALGLAAKDVRIVAPIPGKAAIGIEVPNPVVAMVSLKQTLEPTMADLSDKLLVALGKDISGQTITARLDKMPHLLVAGSTGSGKSVCINGIITSLLMRATPEEVKLLLVDPKKVELSYFNNIPHLLAPVVTDPKKAAFALRKIVQEMEERYEAFAKAGVRNIESYNQQVESADKMPLIVVIIDELADLMLVASKDVEESIMRITQMARAAGIHLIVATQRPSVDVITGVIKANIPSRIAFAVSSQIDSRTILDMGGAEALVGKGDMLFFPSGESKPLRVQGAFVSEAEVIEVVDFIKSQQPTISYNEQLLALDEADVEALNQIEEPEQDPLLAEVVQFVVEQQKASTSLIQRRFKVGYNRAARLMEMMESQAIIGPNEGTKPRQVLKTGATYREANLEQPF